MSELISDEYLDQLQKMRAPNHRPTWGNGGSRHADGLVALIGSHKIKTVLDYGCGHGNLLNEIAKRLGPKTPALAGYDPGIPERAASPEPADLVISTDVLEHIEPEKLSGVLTHLRFLTKKIAYLHIHTGPANAKLPDGRNAHLIQKPDKWWHEQLSAYFKTVSPYTAKDGARTGTFVFGHLKPTFLCQ